MRLIYRQPNPRKRLTDRSPRERKAGFAVIIALALMSFVLVIILSLVILISVETANATNTKVRLLARENARLGLMMALGDLQKHAGPDQRVTARAEILNPEFSDSEQIEDGARLWTGVWDTNDPSKDPVWLVSGNTPDPTDLPALVTRLSENYDYIEDGDYTEPFDAPAVQAEFVEFKGSNARIAWWISDEGVKAALKPQDQIIDTGIGSEAAVEHGYNENTIRNTRIQQDPVFDFEDFFDAKAPPDGIERIINTNQLELISSNLTNTKEIVESQFIHAVNWQNRFVLSNTREGGLKKDLSYLKVLDSSEITQSELTSIFQDPDELITPDLVKLVQHRANPSDDGPEVISGMLVAEEKVEDILLKTQHFGLAPVITEFQLSMGVVAQDGEKANAKIIDSQIYLVHKLYLEIWNPYTVPYRIGDDTMPTEQGFSDLRIEISNLPSFSITNQDRGSTVVGNLPTLSFLWSDYADAKTLRPGMVYRETLPLDTKGANDTGVNQLKLDGLSILGSREDNYQGSFSYNDAVKISIFAVDFSGEEREIFRSEIDGYNDFSISYSAANRVTWFKRSTTSKAGQFGMNSESLEAQGYVFAIRFKMLDEQEFPGTITDISNWLSLYDVRQPFFSVDLNSWDIDEAWSSDPPLPYDFKLNASDTDPSFFEPSESFKATEFFHYNSGGTGRLDRIARFIDFPISEIQGLNIFRTLSFKNFPSNAMGNPHGGDLNRAYDRYFFSTLPNPAEEDAMSVEWGGESPLLNHKLVSTVKPVTLDSIHSARDLLVENGFNLNSTSQLAWEKILSGQSFKDAELELKYEKGSSFPEEPSWLTLDEAVNHAFVNFPQTALFNQVERNSSPRYTFVSREKAGANYLDAFSIDSTTWQNNLQHPAFFQAIREFDVRNIEEDPGDPKTIGDLSAAIVSQLKAFTLDNGHPPLSMEAYLNSGILQNAIDDTPSINNRNSGSDMIPRHTPASITQATLMNQLGKFGFVRSDTFEIRVSAEATAPKTNLDIARAHLTATVQRLPEEHPNSTFGRKFKILNIKWSNEIN